VRYPRCLRSGRCLTIRRVQVSKVGKAYFRSAIRIYNLIVHLQV
jgi:hypothetical protein